MSLSWKLVLASTVLMASLSAVIITPLYLLEKQRNFDDTLDTARTLVNAAEGVRENMADKWAAGVFTTELLSEWAAEGDLDKILSAVPIMAAIDTGKMNASLGDYQFRTPKFNPRNPLNQPDELEAKALNLFKREGLSEYFEFDTQSNSLRYFRPIRLTDECLACHGDPSTSQILWGNSNGLDPTGARMEGWKTGEIHGAFEVIHPMAGAQAKLWHSFKIDAALLAGFSVIAIVLTYLFAKSVLLTPISALRKALQRASAGDFHEQIDVRSKDELGDASRALNQVIAKFADVIDRINEAGAKMVAATREQADGVKNQSTATAEIASTVTKLLDSARSIAENGGQVSDQAEVAVTECSKGAASVEQAVQGIQSVHERVERIAEHMVDLGNQSQKISSVLDIITELSEQTNLLSLNASIEAAGAGEAGKRFAVVANEIRKLAERAADSTNEIRSLIDAVQATVNATMMATEEGTKSVISGVSMTEEVRTSFERILKSVTATTESAKAIEMGSRQQTTSIEQVEIAVKDVDVTTQQTAAAAVHIDKDAQSLLDAAGQISHTD